MTDQQRNSVWRGARQDFAVRRHRLMDRLHARLAGRVPPASGFSVPPEPRGLGDPVAGRDLVAGRFLFDGQLVTSPQRSIWNLGPESSPQALQLQGCGWLDDLAALGDAAARARAQAWILGWIDRYGTGRGPGWTPELTGRRLIRWIDYAPFVLQGMAPQDQMRLFGSLTRQTAWLARRWKTAEPGRGRIAALAGLIEAAQALSGLRLPLDRAAQALGQDAAATIDAAGGIASRNPEELLELVTLLTRAAEGLAEAGLTPPEAVGTAVDRALPVLRLLRHADGGLARFHGGDRGGSGRLDLALAAARDRGAADPGALMGYARMARGRTTLILDAAPPPTGPVSTEAHASTLAFELTSGRRPLVVNCGPGIGLGRDWQRAGRATPSHSTLAIDGYSSSRLGRVERGGSGAEPLRDVPREVPLYRREASGEIRIEAAQDGWRRTHGLTHARTLDLDRDGGLLWGEDLLTTLGTADERRFDRVTAGLDTPGIGFSLRFHLHPDVAASLSADGVRVMLRLRSGEAWVFEHDGAAHLGLEPSVYLENGRLRPRATQQVVLSGRAMAYATQVRWSLAKTTDTPRALRDLARDDVAEDADAVLDLEGRP